MMSQNRQPMRRVTRSKSDAQRSYDKMSRWYDWIAVSEKKFRDAGLAALNAQPGETILDLGFGTGHCVTQLAQSVGHAGMLFGIDLSPQMVQIARRRLQQAGSSHQTCLMCGDAAHLPFQTNVFDGIFLSFVLELFDTPEMPLVLAECRRVLKGNGRITLVALSKEKTNLAVRLYEKVHDLIPNYVDCRPIYAKELLRNAQFQPIRTEQMHMWGLPVDIIVAQKQTHLEET